MKKFLLTLSALGFSASFSFGQIVYEDFEDYPTFPTVNGGSGWTSGWTVAGGPPTIVSFGGSQALQIGYNNNAVLSRSFSSSYTGNFAFSYEMTFNTGSLGSNDFAALWIQDSNFQDHPTAGFKTNEGPNSGSGNNTPTGADIFARIGNNVNKTVWDISNDLTIGETVTFSGLLSKSAPGNYNTLDFYANGTFVGTVVDDAGFSSIGGVGFRTVNLDSGDTIIIDNLRFGTALNSNAEVIPEPSTYALIFGGLVLGVVIFRRKLGKREALETAA